ncbi:DUF397 domain-containing protein [Streptomyces sp. NPDC059063]|uniref:DUF397 domain-containing protein n=1 Tax=unclassified Streptomyces TaxID=2593676 RepID=UPI0036BFB55F
MPQLSWQKSSFSTGGSGECVELAAGPGRVHLRESDRPAEIATATPAALRGLLHHIKAGAAPAPARDA